MRSAATVGRDDRAGALTSMPSTCGNLPRGSGPGALGAQIRNLCGTKILAAARRSAIRRAQRSRQLPFSMAPAHLRQYRDPRQIQCFRARSIHSILALVGSSAPDDKSDAPAGPGAIAECGAAGSALPIAIDGGPSNGKAMGLVFAPCPGRASTRGEAVDLHAPNECRNSNMRRKSMRTSRAGARGAATAHPRDRLKHAAVRARTSDLVCLRAGALPRHELSIGGVRRVPISKAASWRAIVD